MIYNKVKRPNTLKYEFITFLNKMYDDIIVHMAIK